MPGPVVAPAPPAAAPEPTVESAPPRRRAGLTGRAAILALAICAVVLTLVYPLRAYVAQRGQIRALRASNAAAATRVAALQQQEQRWADPAYVKAQARERLHYLMPGETAYVVIRGSTPAAVSVAHAATHGPWYDRLWSSAETAGGAAAR